jgi:hypothetical protein
MYNRMENNNTRAVRRSHAARAKAKARKMLKEWRRYNPSAVLVGRVASQHGTCSCGVCQWEKKPRRTPTMQERKAFITCE